MRRYRCAINDHGQQVPNPVTTLLGEECLARRSTHKDFNRSVKHDVLVVAVNDRLERLQTNKRIILLSALVFQKNYFKRLTLLRREIEASDDMRLHRGSNSSNGLLMPWIKDM